MMATEEEEMYFKELLIKDEKKKRDYRDKILSGEVSADYTLVVDDRGYYRTGAFKSCYVMCFVGPVSVGKEIKYEGVIDLNQVDKKLEECQRDMVAWETDCNGGAKWISAWEKRQEIFAKDRNKAISPLAL